MVRKSGERYMPSYCRNGNHRPLFLYEPVFKENFWISYNVKREDVLRAAKKHNVVGFEISEEVTGKMFSCGKRNNNGGRVVDMSLIWIWVSEPDIPALAHECVHAVTDMFEERGMSLDFNSSEAYAYMVEWLMRETLEDYNCRKKNKKT